MIYYLLGILTGLLLDCILFVTLLYFRPRIETKLYQVSSKLKQKGRIIEDEKNDVTDWIGILPNL